LDAFFYLPLEHIHPPCFSSPIINHQSPLDHNTTTINHPIGICLNMAILSHNDRTTFWKIYENMMIHQ
jgi:hypothetical protein